MSDQSDRTEELERRCLALETENGLLTKALASASKRVEEARGLVTVERQRGEDARRDVQAWASTLSEAILGPGARMSAASAAELVADIKGSNEVLRKALADAASVLRTELLNMRAATDGTLAEQIVRLAATWRRNLDRFPGITEHASAAEALREELGICCRKPTGDLVKDIRALGEERHKAASARLTADDARDAAFLELNRAQAQANDLAADVNALAVLVEPKPGEGILAAVDRLKRERDWATREADATFRASLGVQDGESVLCAAQRVVGERNAARIERDEARKELLDYIEESGNLANRQQKKLDEARRELADIPLPVRLAFRGRRVVDLNLDERPLGRGSVQACMIAVTVPADTATPRPSEKCGGGSWPPGTVVSMPCTACSG